MSTYADAGIRADVAKALGYLCDGHVGNRDAIRAAGGVAAMVQLLNDENTKVRANAVFVVCSLCLEY